LKYFSTIGGRLFVDAISTGGFQRRKWS